MAPFSGISPFRVATPPSVRVRSSSGAGAFVHLKHTQPASNDDRKGLEARVKRLGELACGLVQ
jgi:hypothetical protein